MNAEKMRVLVVSYLPWRNDTSVGNTLSNLFSGLQDRIEFANIYFKGGMPQNDVTTRYFYISEKQLAKSILIRKPVGKEIEYGPQSNDEINVNSNAYDKARQMRWESMLLVQDCIGLMGVWKSEKLNSFVRNFNPDIVFGPLGRVPVSNILMRYIHDEFNVPAIPYAWDDHYSLQKKSASPFFWIKTFVERKYIKQCADLCEYMYTITAPMQREYQKYFNKECKILYKGYKFAGEAPLKEKVGDPVKIVYMGNIGLGRWKVLAKVAQAVSAINEHGKRAELFIYTMSPKSDEMIKALSIKGSSNLMEPVPNGQVLPTMKSADVLLHVEPTDEKDRLFFRLSFSTKIVDYMYNARCIFAIGGDTAAMEYLKDNDAAVVELDENKIHKSLENLLSDKHSIISYGQKAWDCGVRNHQREMIQTEIFDDFMKVVTRGVL